MSGVILGLSVATGLAGMISYLADVHMREYSFPLVNLVFDYQQGKVENDYYSFGAPVINTSVLWNGGLAVFMLSLLAMLGPLAEFVARWQGWLKVSDRRNWLRWIPDSLINPLLATILVTFLGDANTFELLTTFILVHVTTVAGLFLETVNSPLATSQLTKKTDEDTGDVKTRASVTSWPLIFGVWIGVLSYVIPITLISTMSGLSFITGYEWAAAALYVVYQMVSSFIQAGYFFSLYKPEESACMYIKTDGDSYKELKNYEKYNNYLSLNTAVLRSLSIIFLIVTACQPIHVVLPDIIECQSSYRTCQPRFLDYDIAMHANSSAGVTTTVSDMPRVCGYIGAAFTLGGDDGFSNIDTASAVQSDSYQDYPISGWGPNEHGWTPTNTKISGVSQCAGDNVAYFQSCLLVTPGAVRNDGQPDAPMNGTTCCNHLSDYQNSASDYTVASSSFCSCMHLTRNSVSSLSVVPEGSIDGPAAWTRSNITTTYDTASGSGTVAVEDWNVLLQFTVPKWRESEYSLTPTPLPSPSPGARMLSAKNKPVRRSI